MTENLKRREPNFPKIREVPPLRYWLILAAVMMMSGTTSGLIVWYLTDGAQTRSISETMGEEEPAVEPEIASSVEPK